MEELRLGVCGASSEGGKGSGQRRQHNRGKTQETTGAENQEPEDAAGNHGGRGLAGMKRGLRQDFLDHSLGGWILGRVKESSFHCLS